MPLFRFKMAYISNLHFIALHRRRYLFSKFKEKPEAEIQAERFPINYHFEDQMTVTGKLN